VSRTSTDQTDIRQEVAAERRELAVVLAGLPPASWDAPSLCAGWRVREVVAHMTMPFRYSTARFVRNLLRARGNFNAMSDRCARQDAQAATGELLAALAGNESHPWQPPGGGYQAALTHDVIHGLDITIPLGIDRQIPEQRIRLVLDTITTPRSLKHFGAELGGVQLRASDLDWSFGSGSPLSGRAQHLALVVCGRKLPPGRLEGEPSARFTISERDPVAVRPGAA
jgi:uncharacterized protein (TIGR03083 family)